LSILKRALNVLLRAVQMSPKPGASLEASRQTGPVPLIDQEIPHGRLDFRDSRFWVLVTAYRAATNDVVTIDMTLEQWLELPPVQYIIKLELSRQQPRRPTASIGREAAPVPRAHIEWKEGQNWVVLTAFRTRTEEPVTMEFTLWQWMGLIPVRSAVEERLERWQGNKARQLGDIP
jgi:hypothetical protein